VSETERTSDRLARHPLQQSTLKAPLFAGVEAQVLGFEVALLAIAANATQLRLLPTLVTVPVIAGGHVLLALATRADRRLALVFSRSGRYPRHARPWPTLATRARRAEPTFPRRLLA
jgi:hypothetical protein